jgi:hypothetical protein
MGINSVDVQTAVPGLERWLRRVFVVMGGFMMGAGVLTTFVTMSAPSVRAKWIRIALAFAGLFTVGTMSLTNFQLDSDHKWLLLMPSVLWVLGLVSLPFTVAGTRE